MEWWGFGAGVLADEGDGVVRVAPNREDGVTLEQIAADVGIRPMTLSQWMQKAEVEAGIKPGLHVDRVV